MAAPVKVAFTGDQGAGEGARAVLSLIANEGAELLLIQGDLGYADGKAAIWEENLTQALGADFPVLTVVGNHENFEWPVYKQFIQQRIDRADGLSCSGDTGVKALCHYKNIDIVQVSPGINEVEGVKGKDNYAQFIASSFDGSTAPWRICAWHKNQSKMQTGKKSDSTGWDVYDACLDVGAMVALAHEHAYSRSYLLSDFRNQSISHKNSEMTLEPGKSFGFVSGLGGHEVRKQVQGGDWWASIYTASQGATHGALFCTFDETTADCYFKAIDGAVPDQFTLKTRLGSRPEVAAATPVAAVEVAANTSVNDALISEPDTLFAASSDVADSAEAVSPSRESAPAEAEVIEQSVRENIVNVAADSNDSDEKGPLTVVSNQGVTVGDTALSTSNKPGTVVTAAMDVSGDGAGDAVGGGSFSLFMLLVLMSRNWLRRVTLKSHTDPRVLLQLSES